MCPLYVSAVCVHCVCPLCVFTVCVQGGRAWHFRQLNATMVKELAAGWRWACVRRPQVPDCPPCLADIACIFLLQVTRRALSPTTATMTAGETTSLWWVLSLLAKYSALLVRLGDLRGQWPAPAADDLLSDRLSSAAYLSACLPACLPPCLSICLPALLPSCRLATTLHTATRWWGCWGEAALDR